MRKRTLYQQKLKLSLKNDSKNKEISDDVKADLNAAKPELEAAEHACKLLDTAAII